MELRGLWNICHEIYACLMLSIVIGLLSVQDDVIKWKHFPRHWPLVMGIHRSPVNSPHKGLWLGTLMLSLTWAWTSGWANHRDAGDLTHYRSHHDVTVMSCWLYLLSLSYIHHGSFGKWCLGICIIHIVNYFAQMLSTIILCWSVR